MNAPSGRIIVSTSIRSKDTALPQPCNISHFDGLSCSFELSIIGPEGSTCDARRIPWRNPPQRSGIFPAVPVPRPVDPPVIAGAATGTPDATPLLSRNGTRNHSRFIASNRRATRKDPIVTRRGRNLMCTESQCVVSKMKEPRVPLY